MEPVTRLRQELIVEHNLDMGRFLFYPNIMVGEFAEGVHVNKQNAIQPIELAQKFYGNRPFVYISHRLNSYSMNPVGYREIGDLFPNFIGFAIVSENKYRLMIASLEKLFIKKPIKVFNDLENAFSWGEKILEKNLTED